MATVSVAWRQSACAASRWDGRTETGGGGGADGDWRRHGDGWQTGRREDGEDEASREKAWASKTRGTGTHPPVDKSVGDIPQKLDYFCVIFWHVGIKTLHFPKFSKLSDRTPRRN